MPRWTAVVQPMSISSAVETMPAKEIQKSYVDLVHAPLSVMVIQVVKAQVLTLREQHLSPVPVIVPLEMTGTHSPVQLLVPLPLQLPNPLVILQFLHRMNQLLHLQQS